MLRGQIWPPYALNNMIFWSFWFFLNNDFEHFLFRIFFVYTSFTNFLLQTTPEIFLGGPQNLGRVCCSMGPRQLMLYCMFKKNFSEIWGLCCSRGPIFLEKICQNFDIFSEFFSNNHCFKLQNGLKCKSFDPCRKLLSTWRPAPRYEMSIGDITKDFSCN